MMAGFRSAEAFARRSNLRLPGVRTSYVGRRAKALAERADRSRLANG